MGGLLADVDAGQSECKSSGHWGREGEAKSGVGSGCEGVEGGRTAVALELFVAGVNGLRGEDEGNLSDIGEVRATKSKGQRERTITA